MTKRTWILLACAGLAAAGGTLLYSKGEPSRTPTAREAPPFSVAKSREDQASQQEALRADPATPSSTPERAASVSDPGPPSPSPPDTLRDDPQLTSRLAALRKTDPKLALEMTRVVLERDPESQEVPQRTWIAIRALVDLGRREEAKDEARALVRKYPKDHWAQDAERHLLVHP